MSVVTPIHESVKKLDRGFIGDIKDFIEDNSTYRRLAQDGGVIVTGSQGEVLEVHVEPGVPDRLRDKGRKKRVHIVGGICVRERGKTGRELTSFNSTLEDAEKKGGHSSRHRGKHRSHTRGVGSRAFGRSHKSSRRK